MINYQRKAHGFPPPAETVGQKHFWRKADVEQWLAARRTAASPAKSAPGTSAKRPVAPAKSAPGTDVKECGNCADCHQVGRFRVCGSESSPRSKRTVKPDETCDWHRRPGNYRPVRMDEED